LATVVKFATLATNRRQLYPMQLSDSTSHSVVGCFGGFSHVRAGSSRLSWGRYTEVEAPFQTAQKVYPTVPETDAVATSQALMAKYAPL
jgi:hypothetical protein